MADNKVQSYANHRRFVIGYHGVAAALILFVLCLSIIHGVTVMNQPDILYNGVMPFLVSIILLLLWLYVRQFAMKAQDRAIRAEETLRYQNLTGSTTSSLSLGQIIALRFASDAEYPELAKRALAESMSPDDIKKAIRNWRPDTHRV